MVSLLWMLHAVVPVTAVARHDSWSDGTGHVYGAAAGPRATSVIQLGSRGEPLRTGGIEPRGGYLAAPEFSTGAPEVVRYAVRPPDMDDRDFDQEDAVRGLQKYYEQPQDAGFSLQGFVQPGPSQPVDMAVRGYANLRGQEISTDIEKSQKNMDQDLDIVLGNMEEVSESEARLRLIIRRWTEQKKQVGKGFRLMYTIDQLKDTFQKLAKKMQHAMLDPWTSADDSTSTYLLQSAADNTQTLHVYDNAHRMHGPSTDVFDPDSVPDAVKRENPASAFDRKHQQKMQRTEGRPDSSSSSSETRGGDGVVGIHGDADSAGRGDAQGYGASEQHFRYGPRWIGYGGPDGLVARSASEKRMQWQNSGKLGLMADEEDPAKYMFKRETGKEKEVRELRKRTRAKAQAERAVDGPPEDVFSEHY